MIDFKYLSSGNEERIYDYLNNLSNCQGCFCTKSYVRFLHGVYGAPEVDIYINGNLAICNLDFSEITDYALFYSGDYVISVYTAGETTNPLLNKTININRNTAYTAAIVGDLSNFGLDITKEYREDIPPIREAVVAYTNYTPIDEGFDIAISDGTLLYKDITFQETMPNLRVFPDDEQFSLLYTGTDEIVASTPMIELQRNTYYTLYSLLKGDKVILLITLSGLNYLDLC